MITTRTTKKTYRAHRTRKNKSSHVGNNERKNQNDPPDDPKNGIKQEDELKQDELEEENHKKLEDEDPDAGVPLANNEDGNTTG